MIQRIRSKQRRIVQYTLYAWGLPAFITMLSFIVNMSPEQLSLPKPDHGTRTCFFNNRAAKVVYQQGPISLLLALNIVFFLLSSHAICLAIWAPSASENIRQPRVQRFLIENHNCKMVTYTRLQ